jgi:hypothetical protein
LLGWVEQFVELGRAEECFDLRRVGGIQGGVRIFKNVMEWFLDEPSRAKTALAIVALLITAGIIWFGRKRLLSAVPIALVFLLCAAIVIPNAVPVRTAAQRAVCINNLRRIENAKAEWASANNKHAGDIPSGSDLYGASDIKGSYLDHRVACPRGGTYTIGAIGQKPTCSLADKGHKLD